MQALLAILWAFGLCVTTVLVFDLVGMRGVVRLFPEGRRWWQLPAQLASLAAFAALIHFHPF